MTLVFKVLSFVPLWLLHGLGWALGWFTFAASGTYRARFIANARLAGLSRSAWLPAVGEAGKLIAELPRLWLGRAVTVEWDGAEQIERELAGNKGTIFLTPHVGCFEITARAYAERFGSVRPMTILFRPPRQAWLGAVVARSRLRPGLATAETTLAGVKQLIRALKGGQCVGLLPDQVPPKGQGEWVPFFGRDTYTMTLSARLAAQTGASVLVAWGERLTWGRGYVVHVRPLGEILSADTRQATLQINRAMEAIVRRAAGQYLWGYARYKQPRDNG
jgi:KDO2-lipid IV(A) lauroyltransferase